MTEKKHRSVILFGEWQRPLGALSLEQKGMLLDALLAYPEGKRPDFTDPMLRMAWTFMEGGLDETPASGGDPPAPGRGGDKGGREPLAQRRAWQK